MRYALDKDKKIIYPVMMTFEDGSFVVEFSGRCTGTVLKSRNPDWKAGDKGQFITHEDISTWLVGDRMPALPC